MKTQAIIVAAGKGTRLKAKGPKPLVMLGKKPLLVYSLEAFAKCPLVDSIIVVTPKDFLKSFERVVERFGRKKRIFCVVGGKRRCDSVHRGLQALDEDTQCVAIHDGARPFLTEELLRRCILTACSKKAAIAAVPVKPTIKRVDKRSLSVVKTLDRSELWEVQTPQVFKREILLKAYKRLGKRTPTDDAQLVECLGVKPRVVLGSYQNIKITTDEDLTIAKSFLTRK